IVAIMRYEVSNLIKDITVTHCAQHFLGVRVGNGVLELSANRAAPSTFERYRGYIVCDTHPSFMAFVVRYQPITNPDTSDDGGFPALISNEKFALNFYAHVWVISGLRSTLDYAAAPPKKRDELAAPHSITSSARSRIDVGNSTPISLAVLRLTISSNFVGCSTGRSTGFVPFRIFAT